MGRGGSEAAVEDATTVARSQTPAGAASGTSRYCPECSQHGDGPICVHHDAAGVRTIPTEPEPFQPGMVFEEGTGPQFHLQSWDGPIAVGEWVVPMLDRKVKREPARLNRAMVAMMERT